jgi:hypothetical protein
MTQAVMIQWAVHSVKQSTLQLSQEKLPGQVANPTIVLNKIKQPTTLESLTVLVCTINKCKKGCPTSATLQNEGRQVSEWMSMTEPFHQNALHQTPRTR